VWVLRENDSNILVKGLVTLAWMSCEVKGWLTGENNFLKAPGSMSAYRPFARQSLGFGLTPLIIALKSL
jgi:hypothetical protein